MKDGLLLWTAGITILHTIAIVYNGLHVCSVVQYITGASSYIKLYIYIYVATHVQLCICTCSYTCMCNFEN